MRTYVDYMFSSPMTDGEEIRSFFDDYEVRLVPFAIQAPNGDYKFKNSDLIVRYMFAAEQIESNVAVKIIDKIFTTRNADGIFYQDRFNDDYTNEQAAAKLEQWLKEFGFDSEKINQVRDKANSPEINAKVEKNAKLVTETLKVKGIPTMLYDGKKHTGLFKL